MIGQWEIIDGLAQIKVTLGDFSLFVNPRMSVRDVLDILLSNATEDDLAKASGR